MHYNDQADIMDFHKIYLEKRGMLENHSRLWNITTF